MASKTVNDILQNNWNSAFRGYQHVGRNIYFFLKRELDVKNRDEFVVAKSENRIRHCIPYKGHYLDYVVKKEFPTIHDWVKDCGDKMENVLIGSNRVQDGNAPHYMTITELLILMYDYTGPLEDQLKVEIPSLPPFLGFTKRELTDMIDLEMRLQGLTIDNVWVIRDGTAQPWKSALMLV